MEAAKKTATPGELAVRSKVFACCTRARPLQMTSIQSLTHPVAWRHHAAAIAVLITPIVTDTDASAASCGTKLQTTSWRRFAVSASSAATTADSKRIIIQTNGLSQQQQLKERVNSSSSLHTRDTSSGLLVDRVISVQTPSACISRIEEDESRLAHSLFYTTADRLFDFCPRLVKCDPCIAGMMLC